MLRFLIKSDHQLYRVTPLKTQFGLLIPMLQSQPHVTTITIICYAVTRLHNYNPYTPIFHSLIVSITHIHTSNKHSVHTRPYCLALTLKTLNRTSVTAAASKVRVVLRQVTVFTRRCLGNERAAVWRHRGLRGKDTASPTAAQRVLGREAFSGRLPSNALLRNPTMGWHVTILHKRKTIAIVFCIQALLNELRFV
jgi:hypothetical protein